MLNDEPGARERHSLQLSIAHSSTDNIHIPEPGANPKTPPISKKSKKINTKRKNSKKSNRKISNLPKSKRKSSTKKPKPKKKKVKCLS